MDSSKTFWGFMLGVLLLDFIFVESKKLDVAKREILEISERMTEEERKLVDFTTSVAIEGALMALKVSNPLVGIYAGFFVGTLIDAIWPTNSYDSIRADVIKDIRKEMNHQSVERMKMKLRDYGSQIKHLFSILHLSGSAMKKWKKSVARKGLSVKNQIKYLQDFKNTAGDKNFEYFKTKLFSLTTDIGNDRHEFYIPNDPASSLAYYREFATIQINLLACELVILAGDNSQSSLRTELRNKLKRVTAEHYKFVLWAAHKSAAKVEDKTSDWKKYNKAVEMVVRQYPLEEWKKLSNFNDKSKYIRNSDAISLKFVSKKRKWMSCWGSGNKCKLRDCPGVDNPFKAGKQYKYHYECRGEVFWIHGNKRHSYGYVRDCDKVALQYSYWSDRNKGYWLSVDHSSVLWSKSYYYKTRTCPGKSFFKSKFGGRCANEVFKLYVEGKKCGDKLEDRDVVILIDKDGKYVGGNNPLKPSRSSKKWRIFKLNSFIKSY